MKRKLSELNKEEHKLSHLLFNQPKKFIEKIKVEDNKLASEDLKPAWVDEDDLNFGDNIIENTKSKGLLYTERLKQKYETLIGTPKWAKLNKKNHLDDDDEILRTVGHLYKSKSTSLPKDLLQLKKLPIVNKETRNEGPIISCVEFHPKMSVSLVAGQSGVVSLFSIGSDVNSKLHSFKLKKWKISAAQFSPDGSEAFIASTLSHSYCVYNLIKAESKLVQLPQVVKRPKIFQISNDGVYLATSNGSEEVYVICTAAKELLKELKHNTNIESVCFSADSKQLYCYGSQGEITIWDLSTYRSLQKFYDQGCVTASTITSSSCGKLLATGSGEGIVNIYETSNLTTKTPEPIKTVSNLTTKIMNLKFNSATEILAASSSYYPNAVKLVHIPSYHVFANFPYQATSPCRIASLNFSPSSGYMAVGNNKGSACLYRLKHYKNY